MSTQTTTSRTAGARSVRTRLIAAGCVLALLAGAYGFTALNNASAASLDGLGEAPTIAEMQRDERARQVRQRPADLNVARPVIRVTAP